MLSQLSYSPVGSTLPVGPARLELATPRLSSVCSNQLSYGPNGRWWLDALQTPEKLAPFPVAENLAMDVMRIDHVSCRRRQQH